MEMKDTSKDRKEYSCHVTTDAIKAALKMVKAEKAPGPDRVHLEFVLNYGKYCNTWLAEFITDHVNKHHSTEYETDKYYCYPQSDKPKSYRPIVLLSTIYKRFERLLYNKISPGIFKKIRIEQAGFCPKRSCIHQVLPLPKYIQA